MKLLSTKSRPESDPVTPEELIEALGRKRDDLLRRDKELLKSQLRLERDGVSPAEATAGIDPAEVAAQIIGDGSPRFTEAESAAATLRSIIVQRQAIAKALEILGRDETRQRAVAVADAMQTLNADWFEINRRRVAALLALRRANADAEKFRSHVRKIGPVALKADFTGAPYFGPPVVEDRVYQYLRACVDAGIISRDEIDA